jgi:trans-aconitate 2-methyltransferase
MEKSKDWNPELYLKYGNERTQPSIDLVSKIKIDFKPESILDVGCGHGNSSQVLLQRWPDTKLTGIDSSQNMIEKAKVSYPNNTWLVADAAKYTPDVKYDIVFSNATIQWIPDHERLFQNLFNLVNNGGVLAISTPRFDEMLLFEVISRVIDKEKWKKATRGCAELFTYHDYKYYYDLMDKYFESIELWQTDYIHILESQYSIIEWIRSTGMKPYLDCLKEAEKPLFENDILAEIKIHYPLQKSGKVLFPFKRLFMVGYK